MQIDPEIKDSHFGVHSNSGLPIKAVVFDLGNVLIDFDHMIAARRLSKLTQKTPLEIFDLFFDSPLTHLFEEGKISPLQFFSEVKKTLSLKIGYDEFAPIWNEIFFFSGKNAEVYNLANRLKARYRVAVVSNINVLHFEYIKRTFPVLDTFSLVITSFEVGVSKPSPLIYRKTLEALGVAAADVFYADDRPELVESARSLGIRGFVFKDVLQLKKDLCGCALDAECK